MGSPRSGCGETRQVDSTIGTRIAAGFQYRSGIAGLRADDINSINAGSHAQMRAARAPPLSHFRKCENKHGAGGSP